jgi:hypothetical protein
MRVFLRSSLVTAERRNDCLSATALFRKPCRLKPVVLVISRSTSATRGANGTSCFVEQGGRGRNARATSRAFTRLWMFSPQQLLSESPARHWLCRNQRQTQERSRFAGATLTQFMPRSNTKTAPICEETVDDATSLWKPEEN